MNKENSWKRMQEMEIDFADLLKKLFLQWKQIFLCALAAAAVLGGYGWMKEKNSQNEQKTVMSIQKELTEEQKQAILAAVSQEKEIRGLKEYLDSTVLMRIDPYHKNRAVMLYEAGRAKHTQVQKIIGCYLSFIADGGAVDSLEKTGKNQGLDKNCLSELISAYQKTYSTPYQVLVSGMSDDLMADSVFCVEVTGEDAEKVRQLALNLQSVIKSYHEKAEDIAGNHTLKLLSMQINEYIDGSLQTWQHDKRSQLSAYRTNLKAMTDSFNENQMKTYCKTAGLKMEKMEEETDNGEEIAGTGIKYTLFGIAGGIFLYCSVFGCFYMMKDTVKSVEEMKRIYTFPCYGQISIRKKKSRKQNAFEKEKAMAVNRIRMACKNSNLTTLYMVSDFSFSEKEKECLEFMVQQLERCGIELIIGEKGIMDTTLWEKLAETGNVLMVCRIETTTHQNVNDAMEFYVENHIKMIGTVAFS